MNKFFTKTLIPTPNVNWKLVWPEITSPIDPIVFLPRWRFFDPTPELREMWPDGDTVDRLLEADLVDEYRLRIFRWVPNLAAHWHLDGVTLPRYCGINWILEGAGEIHWDSTMKFDENSTIPFKQNASEPTDKSEMICDGHACLVNSDIPHKLMNLNSIHRVTAGLLFKQHLTYFDVQDRLESVGLI